MPFDWECNFGKKRNQKRIRIKFLYLVCLILQHGVKNACLSLNPVVLFFFLPGCVWFRERISSD